MRLNLSTYAVLAGTALAAVACGAVERDPDDTSPPTTSVSPPPGAYRAIPTITLTADEPATIYYTVDGSEPTTSSPSGADRVEVTGATAGTPVRFFAVDRAGNAEAPRSVAYDVGAGTPAPVRNLRAVASGTDVTVSWEAPTGDTIAGVLLVRLRGAPEQPIDGLAYRAGDEGLGGVVVYRGASSSYTDTGLVPGAAVYAAFVVDAAGFYSRGTLTSTAVPIPPQPFGMTIVTGPPTQVSVNGSPPNFGLGVMIHNASNDARPMVAISLRNETSRVLYNPKLVIRSATVNGAMLPEQDLRTFGDNEGAGPVAGHVGGRPFFWLRPIPRGWPPGAVRTLILGAENRAPGQTISLQLEIRDDPLVVTMTSWNDDRRNGGELFDGATGRPVGALTINVSGPGQDFGYRGGVFSPDGRFLYLGSRNAAQVTAYDLVTMGETQTLTIRGEHTKGHLHELQLGPDGRTLYALFVDGAHAYASSTPAQSETPIHVELLALDRVTWAELGRVRLALRSPDDDAGRRGRRFAISPDGSRAAIPVIAGTEPENNEGMGSVHVVDLVTMTELDADPGTPGVQPYAMTNIPVQGGGTVAINPKVVGFAGDGRVLVASRSDQRGGDVTIEDRVIVEIDLATHARLAVPSPGAPTQFLAAAGTIWMAGRFSPTRLHAYDPATRAITPHAGYAPSSDATILAPNGPDHLLVVVSSNRLERVRLATGVVEWSAVINRGAVGNWIGTTPF